MALTFPKIVIILLALLNLIFIAIASALGKTRLAISLSVIEALIVTSSSYFD